MKHSPLEMMKEKLLKALDKEYNVVDMGTVVEIITILERTPITKEALEETNNHLLDIVLLPNTEETIYKQCDLSQNQRRRRRRKKYLRKKKKKKKKKSIFVDHKK
ncbi:hypothetical protein C0J52_08153 [Blattella germanica]|nr:hypothetical protein C0J52_08153 [Blattella germanica]